MPGVYLCEITENKSIADQTFMITVMCEEIASDARAGQFININCGEGLLLRRPVSICGTNGKTFRFAVEIKGEGTRRLAEYMPGAKLDIVGPLGNGFLIPAGSVLVVSGGIGAPPLLFAAETAKGTVTAILGFRDSSRIIMKSEFEAACDKVCITTDDGSYGVAGQVTVPLETFLESGVYDAVLACGPRAMLRNVSGLCKQHGVPCQVSMEQRMGCGVGACLVCACETAGNNTTRMSRVCKDGPVFDADTVVWEQ